MGSIINELKIHSLRARIEATKHRAASLAGEAGKAITSEEKMRLDARFEHAMKQAGDMEFLLGQLENPGPEAVGAPAIP